MNQESTGQSAERCQWCGHAVQGYQLACASCGAVLPSLDDPIMLHVATDAGTTTSAADLEDSPSTDEVEKARQILIDLDAYVADEQKAPSSSRSSDPADDAMVIIGVLVIAGGFGALAGWVIAPSLLHDLFQNSLGVEADGPESFRRLGAFLGALVSMLFGATFATLIRR